MNVDTRHALHSYNTFSYADGTRRVALPSVCHLLACTGARLSLACAAVKIQG